MVAMTVTERLNWETGNACLDNTGGGVRRKSMELQGYKEGSVPPLNVKWRPVENGSGTLPRKEIYCEVQNDLGFTSLLLLGNLSGQDREKKPKAGATTRFHTKLTEGQSKRVITGGWNVKKRQKWKGVQRPRNHYKAGRMGSVREVFGRMAKKKRRLGFWKPEGRREKDQCPQSIRGGGSDEY